MVHLLQSMVATVETATLNVAKKLTTNNARGIKYFIKADVDNVSDILIGGSSPTYPLSAGESISELGLPLLDEIFYQGATNNDKLHVLIYEDPAIHELRDSIAKLITGKELDVSHFHNGKN